MADKRSARIGNELPAEEPRRKSPSTQSRKPEPNKLGSESQHLKQHLHLPDDDLFSDPHEPNDESPTIISTKNSEAIQAKSNGSADFKGRCLAHYELGEPIGVGGMAAVLRARDTQLDRTVALKILPPEMAKDPENIRRFHQEARAAAKLDHENIARVFYCGEDQGLHFIAFEFVEGENLRTILERRGQIPAGEALRYVRQVATGLDHAASRGVVHRDIKPSNIIITPTGKAKVVDMGLARSLEPHADDGLTQSGVTLGTFDYISPEQALEPREADSRSDIYSLGCTLYHMLTGHPAVPEGTAAKKLHHHQHIAPTDPRQLNPEIPDDVALVLSKMMAKDPRQRYQRPIELVQQLARICKRFDGDGPRGDAQDTYFDVNVPEPRSRPLVMVSVAVLALAALLFALSLAPNTNKKTDPPKIVKAAPVDKKPPIIEIQPVAPPPPAVAVLRTEDDLQKLIDQAPDNETLFIPLENDIVLTGKLKISSKARPVEIYGAGRQPTKLTLKIDKTPASDLVGLRVSDAAVKFRNLKFEISLAENAKLAGDVPVAAVALGAGSTAEFHQCIATQNVPLDGSAVTAVAPAASVWIDAAQGPNKSAYFHDCVFHNGQTGIAITGSGTLTARDCAFSSLGSIVQAKGGGDPAVTFEHCSAYLRNGPAFRVDEGADCQIKVARSIFTVPALKGPVPAAANVLVKQADTDTSKILFQGQSNFYRLQLLWTNGAPDPIVRGVNSFDSPGLFKEKGRKGSYDDSQFEKTDSPSPFANEFARGDDLNAFLLSPIRELQPTGARILGIRKFLGVDMVAKRPPLPVDVAANNDQKLAPGERLLEPEDLVKEGGFFPAGNAFVLKTDAMNNDFILKWKEVETDLSLRGLPGAGGALPTLKFARRDPYLFKLLGGKLTLENINLVIAPDREGRQTLVALDGFGTCTLKNCTITMRPLQGTKSALSVVAVSTVEDGKMMMPDPGKMPDSVPTVVITDCFIRGDGDVVALKESRPVNLQVSRSLTVLGGSLLHQQQAAAKDANGKEPAASDVIALRMSNSAFFFAEPLLTLQAAKPRPWVQHPVRVDMAEQCLFATLEDRPLVSMETLEAPEKLAAVFDWRGAGNAYAQFKTAPVLEQTTGDYRLDETGWKETIDRGSLFLPNGFKVLPTRPYAAAKPSDYVIRSESLDDLQSYMQLPRFQVPD